MSRPDTQHPPDAARQQALLVLLGDDDPAIKARIEATLLQQGEATLVWLAAHRLHPDPVIRRRILRILHTLQTRQADARFLAFILSHGEQFDLESAVWLFAACRHPGICADGYRALLDQWADEIRMAWVRDVHNRPLTGAEMLALLNTHLFEHLAFKGNEAEYFDPDNSYLNRVVDRRLGNPIALCLLYQFIAQRLRIPVRGVGMPGHFLCRYQTPREEYYIDAFHGGRLLSRQDCIRRLKQFAMEYDEGALQPISPRRTLQRMVANLHLIHKERRNSAEVERLQRYLVALAR